MKATICDKCGKVIKDANFNNCDIAITGAEKTSLTLDLCNKCEEDVRSWLKESFKDAK